jgi:lysophospholipase L1-like esterase
MMLRNAFAVFALSGVLLPAGLPAQTAAATPTPKPTAEQISAWQKAHEEQMKNDWPWLGRFKEADEQLGPPAPGENRVVFMGDSITQGWDLDKSFPDKHYINRGISGQTTPQMVLRFFQDVINLKPKVVVILAGTNDIAENTGPMTLEQTEDNLAAMSEMAAANHIRVVLCSITPAFDYPWHKGLEPAAKIDRINAWIKSYAAENGDIYVDYHSAMKDSQDGLPPNLSKDGVHPNAAGYAIMAPLAEAGIERALAK